LYPQYDYENFEFSSPLNPWQIQSQYKADFDKIKCLDVVMQKGEILYLPPYWWYSIEFGNEATVCSFKYKTYMNTVAILPQLIMKLLQSQNVKRNHMKKMQAPAAVPMVPEEVLPLMEGLLPLTEGVLPLPGVLPEGVLPLSAENNNLSL
jgi:ribosomal protein L16 Arg81 hydroxylase